MSEGTSYLLVFMHGWGFNADYWKPFVNELGLQEDYFLFDRGYFGQECRIPDLAANRKLMVVTHSYGLHLFPKKYWKQVSHLLILGGFNCFHPKTTSCKSLPKGLLMKMIKKIRMNPRATLKLFYDLCGADYKASYWDVELLYQDLLHLSNASLDLQLLNGVPRVSILHGGNDRVVPVERALDLHGSLLDSHLTVIDNLGHHLVGCGDWIREWTEQATRQICCS